MFIIRQLSTNCFRLSKKSTNCFRVSTNSYPMKLQNSYKCKRKWEMIDLTTISNIDRQIHFSWLIKSNSKKNTWKAQPWLFVHDIKICEYFKDNQLTTRSGGWKHEKSNELLYQICLPTLEIKLIVRSKKWFSIR
jgi:hypothetical protein